MSNQSNYFLVVTKAHVSATISESVFIIEVFYGF